MLLNEGLETIGESCFEFSGLEEATIPGSVRNIGRMAFSKTLLGRVRFRGAAVRDPSGGPSESQDSGSEGQLAIGEEAFAYCIGLRQVVFDPDSTVTEIQRKAFWGAGLESFAAPPSLRKIGAQAFGECRELKTFELNEGIRELGQLCLWDTGVADVRLPPHVNMTREQLGLGQDPKVLRLPDGLEVVEDDRFSFSDIRKLIIPSTVKRLGDRAFKGCYRLREVVFEAGSQLETIGRSCFNSCDIERMTIPRSVRDIGNGAFDGCRRLCSLAFEDGSQLERVGRGALLRTPLEDEKGLFPRTARADGDAGARQ